MHNLLENKHKSLADFRAFLAYMIDKRNYLQRMPEKEQEVFKYHYDRLPQYFEQFMQKYDMDILRATAGIQIVVISETETDIHVHMDGDNADILQGIALILVEMDKNGLPIQTALNYIKSEAEHERNQENN